MIRVVCSKCGYLIAVARDVIEYEQILTTVSRCPNCGRELSKKPIEVVVR